MGVDKLELNSDTSFLSSATDDVLDFEVFVVLFSICNHGEGDGNSTIIAGAFGFWVYENRQLIIVIIKFHNILLLLKIVDID